VSDTFVVTVNQNQPPELISAIPDQSLFVNQTIELDLAEYFTDAEGDPLVYSVSLSSGDAAPSFINLDGHTLTIAPTADAEPTTYSIEVSATDNSGALAVGSFDVLVTSQPPQLAHEIPPQDVFQGQTVELDFNDYFRDPEGNPLAYSVGLVSGGDLPSFISLDGPILTIAPSYDSQIVSYSIQVEASDGQSLISDVFLVSILQNQPPELISEIPDQTVLQGQTVTLDLNDYFEVGNGDAPLTVVSLANGDPAPSFISVIGPILTIAPDGNSEATSLDIRVAVVDSFDGQASDTFVLTVVSTAPQLVSEIPDQTVIQGQTVTLDLNDYFEVADGESALTVVSLANGDAAPSFISEKGPILTIAPDGNSEVTSLDIRVTVVDSYDRHATDTFVVTVVSELAPEQVLEIPEFTMTPAYPLQQTPHAFYADLGIFFQTADGSPIDYFLNMADGTPLPEFVTFKSDYGNIKAMPTDNSEVGEYHFVVTASNDFGSVTADLILHVEESMAPVLISAVTSQSVNVGGQFNLDMSAHIEAAGGGVAYIGSWHKDDGITVTDLPAFMTLGTQSGSLQIAPDDNSQAGSYNIELTVFNAHGGINVYFDLAVESVNAPPQLHGTIPDRKVTVGQIAGFNVAPYFQDSDSTLTYSAVLASGGSLPLFIQLESGTGHFQFAPIGNHDVGGYQIRVSASDGEFSASGEFHLTVEAGVAPPAGKLKAAFKQVSGAMQKTIADAIFKRMKGLWGPGRKRFAGGASSSLASLLHTNASDVDAGDWRQILDGQMISYSLSSDQGANSGMWLRSDTSHMGQKQLGSNWTGEINSVLTGVDSQISGSMVAGIIYSSTGGDFSTLGIGDSSDFKLGSQLRTVHPWLGFRMGGLNLWVVSGEGTGTLDSSQLNQSATAALNTDMALTSVQYGANYQLSNWLDIGVQSAGSTITVGSLSEIAGFSMQLQESKASISAGRSFRLAQTTLTPQATFTMREQQMDGVILADESGAEMDLKLHLRQGSGFELEIGHRAFASHTGEQDESGAYLSLNLDFGIVGRGFNFRLRPSQGQLKSRRNELLNGLSGLAPSGADQSTLMAEMAYPMATGSAWLIAPYTRMERNHDSSQTRSLGARFNFGSAIEFSWAGQQHTLADNSTERGIEFKGRLRF
ncbi:MAG: putative Ig domain-containing protein, partial [Gammaproteobacteria bacterium]